MAYRSQLIVANAFNNSTASNATGDGTIAQVVLDTFASTIPTTTPLITLSAGDLVLPTATSYLVTGSITLSGLAAGHTTGVITLANSLAATVTLVQSNFGAQRTAGNTLTVNFSVVTLGFPAVTLSLAVQVSGSTKTVNIVGNDATLTSVWCQALN